jgi:hypothetical protein
MSRINVFNKRGMIDYLTKNNGKLKEETWTSIGKEYGIKPLLDKDDKEYKRKSISDQARNIWRSYLKQRNGLELTKEIYENGQLKWETLKKTPEDTDFDRSGLELVAVTTNPHGGEWLKFKKQAGFGEEDFKYLKKEIGKETVYTSKKLDCSGIINIDIADIHLGLVNYLNDQTIRKPEFNLKAVDFYLQQVVDIINSEDAEEVHLWFIGDLIESATGGQHPGTWKTMQHMKNNVAIMVYELLKKFIRSIDNVKCCYFVEGNHDRLTEKKEGQIRRGLVEIVAYFLQENMDCEIKYHPLLLTQEIDGMVHIGAHGDAKMWNKNIAGGYGSFLRKYGKSRKKFHIMKTGHFHSFNIVSQGFDYIHMQCASICTGSLYEEAFGGESVPGVTIIKKENDYPRIDFRPLKIYKRKNKKKFSIE